MNRIDKYNPIFVTGIERSGSSFITNIIRICGGFTGTVNNRMENVRLKELTNEYYRKMGIDERGQYPLPAIQDLSIPASWKKDVEQLLKAQNYNGSTPWVYKSSRLAQTWPVWDYAYPSARWVIVRRSTRDIINSCLQTDFMNAYKDKNVLQEIGVNNEREGWVWWTRHHTKLFRGMLQKGLNCMVIWPERMLEGDYRQIHEMLHWLNLEWDQRIVAYVDELLGKYKNENNGS